jgi:uncharacterized protein with beta-barrel porin domain
MSRLSYHAVAAVVLGSVFSVFALASAQAACPPSVSPAESPAPGQFIGSNSECTVEAGALIARHNEDGITGVDFNTIVINGEIAMTGNSAHGIVVDNGNSIFNTGAISVFGFDATGINVGNDNSVINRGSISTGGFDADAIRAVNNNTIVNNGTITTPGSDADGVEAGDGNAVTNNGVISTTGTNATGITVGDENSVIHRGSIVTTGNGASAIRAEDNNVIINSGSLTTAATGDAIEADNDNTVTNTGSITINGDAQGIDVAFRNTVTNAGTITATANGARGIDANGRNSVLNSGHVATMGDSSYGVAVNQLNTFTNTGSITTIGGNSDAVFAGNENTINNTGVITTSGVSAAGIIADNDNVINNAGAVIATGAGSNSFQMLGTGNTLNLLQNSRVVGTIQLGISGGNTANLGRGENWMMTFQSDPLLDGNTVNTFGVPTAILNAGLTFATFDVAATVFGAQATALYDLTETINAALHQRLTAGNPTTYLWAQGFGAKRSADESGGVFTPAAGDVELSGGMLGFSTPLSSSARGGLFAGYTDGSIASQPAGSIGDNSRRHVIDQESWFAGAYGRAFWGQAFADLIVTAGETQNDSTRRILNNLAPTGVEFATGAYDGWFFNPELTLGVELPLGGGVKLVPSASVGYAGVYLDALTETGSQAAITLAARDVELIDGRLQLELRSKGEALLGTWHTALRGGIKGRSSVGDDALTGVLATTTAFTVTPLDTDDVVAAFTGADLTFAVAPGVQVFAGGESTFEDDGDFIVTGRAGAALKF